ncbi:MAG: hypothetical protein MZV65_19510 [Chromatiales bacterium]|nr:hypothetical protein [Chromatiales bacterium]
MLTIQRTGCAVTPAMVLRSARPMVSEEPESISSTPLPVTTNAAFEFQPLFSGLGKSRAGEITAYTFGATGSARSA